MICFLTQSRRDAKTQSFLTGRISEQKVDFFLNFATLRLCVKSFFLNFPPNIFENLRKLSYILFTPSYKDFRLQNLFKWNK